MQQDDGTFKQINTALFDKVLGVQKEHARVIREGDVFMIRGCRFEVTEIREGGITAKGIPPDPEKNLGRNDPCLCGSGKKLKKCCGRLLKPTFGQWKPGHG